MRAMVGTICLAAVAGVAGAARGQALVDVSKQAFGGAEMVDGGQAFRLDMGDKRVDWNSARWAVLELDKRRWTASSWNASDMPREEFVSEEMVPVAGTGDAKAMSRGEPGLPGRFRWRGQEYRVAGIIKGWKTTGPCKSGGGEIYLRKHWYKVLTEPHAVMTVYCQRQPMDRRRAKSRWYIYSIESESET